MLCRLASIYKEDPDATHCRRLQIYQEVLLLLHSYHQGNFRSHFIALKPNWFDKIILFPWKACTLNYIRVHPLYTFAKILRKTNISNPLIRTLTYAYQGVRNVMFLGNFAYVLNGWPQVIFSVCLHLLVCLHKSTEVTLSDNFSVIVSRLFYEHE